VLEEDREVVLRQCAAHYELATSAANSFSTDGFAIELVPACGGKRLRCGAVSDNLARSVAGCITTTTLTRCQSAIADVDPTVAN